MKSCNCEDGNKMNEMTLNLRAKSFRLTSSQQANLNFELDDSLNIELEDDAKRRVGLSLAYIRM